MATKELRLQGSPICAGIAIGSPYVLSFEDDDVQEIDLAKDEVDDEVRRFQSALEQCRVDVERLYRQLEEEGALEGAAILDTQLEVMRDPLLSTQIEEEIRSQKKNAEFIFQKVIRDYQEKFDNLNDHFFRERFRDILDVCRRVMRCLQKQSASALTAVPHQSVVFSPELAPSQTAEANSSNVGAFVTATGGGTSHAAIVAKAKGIPYVVSVDFRSLDLREVKTVIVDGRTGDIILNPKPKTLQKYRSVQEQLEGHFRSLEKAGSLIAETYDGYPVKLSANMEVVSDLETLHEYGSGIGLFRSEFIVLSKANFPSEEEQFRIYKRLVEKMRGLPVVIRTFDIGGDKLLPNYVEGDRTSLEGYRSIRLMLKEKDIFKAQLRAILRASAYGDLSIMFPMVTGPGELREAKTLLGEARGELEERGIHIEKRIRIGCMIEVPSAAIISDVLAKECDFLSIGTNDLVQYSLAVDREDFSDSVFLNPTHPSVIRLIKIVVTEGARQGIPVTVCGEIAADPKFTALLLGLGVRELSVALRYIPIVKNAVRNTSIVEASQLAERVMCLSTSKEIQDVLEMEYAKIRPMPMVVEM